MNPQETADYFYRLLLEDFHYGHQRAQVDRAYKEVCKAHQAEQGAGGDVVERVAKAIAWHETGCYEPVDSAVGGKPLWQHYLDSATAAIQAMHPITPAKDQPQPACSEIPVVDSDDGIDFTGQTPLEALRNLIYWKNYKDENGKDTLYQEAQRKAWKIARATSEAAKGNCSPKPVMVDLSDCTRAIQRELREMGVYLVAEALRSIARSALDATGVKYDVD